MIGYYIGQSMLVNGIFHKVCGKYLELYKTDDNHS